MSRVTVCSAVQSERTGGAVVHLISHSILLSLKLYYIILSNERCRYDAYTQMANRIDLLIFTATLQMIFFRWLGVMTHTEVTGYLVTWFSGYLSVPTALFTIFCDLLVISLPKQQDKYWTPPLASVT